MTQNPNIISAIMIGGTGVGKSQLGNRLVNKNAFKIGEEFESETKTKKAEFGKIGNFEVRIIDTPGFFDTKNPGNDNYEKMSYIIDLFKDDTDIDGIIFVFNFKDVRKDQRYKELIRNLRDIFGMDVLKKRLKIIFTNASHGVEYNKKKEEKQREQMVEFIGKEIIQKDDMIFINTHENLINNYMEDIIGLFEKFNEIKKMYGSMDNQKMEKIKKELEEKKKKELEENQKKELEKNRMEEKKEKEKEKEIDKKTKKLTFIRDSISSCKNRIYEIEKDIDDYKRKIKGAEKGIAASAVFVAFTAGLSGIGIAHCMDEKKSFQASISRLEEELRKEKETKNRLEAKERQLTEELEKLYID